MEKKKKTKNKKRFTWVNLAQLLTMAALLLWMQWAVDSGRVLTIFVASPTSIVEEGIKIIHRRNLMAPLIADDPRGTGRLSVCCGGRCCSGTDLDLVSGIGEVHECILFGNHGSSESSNPAAVDPVVRHRLPVQGISGISVLGIYDPVQYRDRSQGV